MGKSECLFGMLDFINKNGIRSAVISNLLWSGDALSERLNRLLLMNEFEFVMTSSDYIVRKPTASYLISLYGKPGCAPAKYGIAGIIRKQILRARRRLGYIPFGTRFLY